MDLERQNSRLVFGTDHPNSVENSSICIPLSSSDPQSKITCCTNNTGNNES